MTDTLAARARRDLFKLLDAFPEDALNLHAAFAGDAVNGGNATGSVPYEPTEFARSMNTEEELTQRAANQSCACAIGTIADGTGLKWATIAARVGRPHRGALETLPALEQFIIDIRPDLGQHRTKTVTRWIEEWMRQQDEQAA